jgi:hypothetical protein
MAMMRDQAFKVGISKDGFVDAPYDAVAERCFAATVCFEEDGALVG